jgi:hypothetical protein
MVQGRKSKASLTMGENLMGFSFRIPNWQKGKNWLLPRNNSICFLASSWQLATNSWQTWNLKL